MLIVLYVLIATFVGLLMTAGVLGYRERAKAKDWEPKTERGWNEKNSTIEISHPIIKQIYDQYGSTMIGQDDVFVWLIWCWLAGGHCLLTGLPGTGKTQAVKTFVQLMWLDMGRVQGTSDLLPVDITGSLIYNPKTSEFDTVFGPIMHEVVLVDEINRMPSKTQSALLQAMAEWSIVVGQTSYNLPEHFTVFATQNPHDRVGTFPLPQAQLDRFMCQVVVEQWGQDVQGKILNQVNKNMIAVSPLWSTHSSIKGDGGTSEGFVWEELLNECNQITVPKSITSSVAQLLQDQWLSSRAGQHIITFARAVALMGNKQQVDQSDLMIALNYTIKHRI